MAGIKNFDVFGIVQKQDTNSKEAWKTKIDDQALCLCSQAKSRHLRSNDSFLRKSDAWFCRTHNEASKIPSTCTEPWLFVYLT